MIELGQVLFGNRMESYLAPDWLRDSLYESDLEDRIEEATGKRSFSCDVFDFRPYWWGECVCNGECLCQASLPNFHYKPTNFRVHWYKHPCRGTTVSRRITPEEWAVILIECKTIVSARNPKEI